MARQAVGGGPFGPAYINETGTRQNIGGAVSASGPTYINETVSAPAPPATNIELAPTQRVFTM